jgi:uncharacterized protein DUF4038/collagenase-like protein with putative collagen-binding domain
MTYGGKVVRNAVGAALMTLAAWPLQVSASGPYLERPNGTPFLVIGSALWNLHTQATSTAQIDTILENRAAAGYTSIIVEAYEHEYSDQTPRWANAISGAQPFTTTSSTSVTWTNPNSNFWTVLEHLVAKAKSLGMLVIINPAYMGYANGTDGWMAALDAASNADVDSFGTFFGNTFGPYGNVAMCAGGDYAGDNGVSTPGSQRNKQARIFAAAVATGHPFLITGHTARSGDSGAATDGDSYVAWNTFTWFNWPSIYAKSDASDAYALCATAYARGLAFLAIEGPYEDAGGSDNLRKYAWQSALSGACGVFGGSFIEAQWGCGATNITGGNGVASFVTNGLATQADAEMGHLRNLLVTYNWWTRVPKTDASLVNTSLGSGTGRVCPALGTYSGGNFALIYTPGVNVTVVMTNFSQSSVRARWYNPQTGGFTAIGTFANTGTQAFTAPGERVLVLD